MSRLQLYVLGLKLHVSHQVFAGTGGGIVLLNNLGTIVEATSSKYTSSK